MIAGRELVEARLGREPQDMLEAAVVLEAWAGVPPQRALASARELMPRVLRAAEASATPPPRVPRPPRLWLEGAALVVTVPAIAFWSAPLAADLGPGELERAVRIALPVALALQWMLHSRFFGRSGGLAELGRCRWAVLAAALLIAAIPLAWGSESTGLLAVIWTAGAVLLRRGWAAVYVGLVLAATAALLTGAHGLTVLLAAAAAAMLATLAALPRPAATERTSLAARHSEAVLTRRTLGAGMLGGGLGVLLVGDPSVSWAAGSLPALALLPAAAGGFAGGTRLWRLQSAVPRALSGVPAGERRPPARGPIVALLGAAGLLIAVTAAGSAGLSAVMTAPTGMLAGFGLLALATFLAGVLESLGCRRGAGCAIAAAALTEVVAGTTPAFAGAGLVAGGAVAVAALVPLAVARLARPDRTLATSLWIP